MNEEARSTLPQFALREGSALRRRGQRVVVRAGEASMQRTDFSPIPPEVFEDRRRPMPTLTGLGEELFNGSPEHADSDRSTLPDFSFDFEDSDMAVVPLSQPRVTLRDGIDGALADAYRQEAERIIASGVFPKTRRPSEPAQASPPPPASMTALGHRLG